ncbi:MAG: helix-turn-helix domain-containing protein [Lentisphaeria bacterium]|nr:helix-turn-helix domain-containing protein [Lentisphaeria bacterium]
MQHRSTAGIGTANNVDCESVLKDCEAAFGISLTVHDELGLLRGRNGENLLPGRHIHAHPYCWHSRKDREFDRRCLKQCVTEVNRMLSESNGEMVESRCYKGVREIVVPVWRNGMKALTLFAGAFRRADDCCPLDGPEADSYFERLPLLDDAQARRLERMLRTLGVALLQLAWEKRGGDDGAGPENRKRMIERFINHNAHRSGVSMHELAGLLYLSNSRTGHVVVEECGAPFHFLLNQERIMRAKQLLASVNLPLGEIAARTGFHSIYYFSRIFKQFEGISPARFRQRSNEAK